MDRFGRRTTPELNLVCLEGRTNLYLNVPGYFFADNENWGEVTVRIGNAKARVIAMQRSTNREAIGLWNGRGIALAKTMDGKAQFLWRVTPYGENAETFVFGGSGFSAALREVKKACKW